MTYSRRSYVVREIAFTVWIVMMEVTTLIATLVVAGKLLYKFIVLW